MSFPSLMAAQTTQADGTQHPATTANTIAGKQSLRVALPIGEDALAALRLLFLAKQSGLLNQEAGQYIGQQIAMDDLRQFDSSLELRLVAVSLAEGAGSDQLKTWQAAANMPDIVYGQNTAASVGLVAFQDIADYLFDSKLLAATHIYAATLESVRRGNAIYGVPYLASTPLLFFNRTLLNQYSSSLPAADWSWIDWRSLIEKTWQAIGKAGLAADPTSLANLADDPEGLSALLAHAIFAMDDPAELLAYLPASTSLAAGWAAWDGQKFDYQGDSFANAVDWLQKALPAGSSPVHLDAGQQQTAFKGQPARQSGRVLMWTGDSTDLAVWHQQTNFMVTECLMPSSPTERLADAAVKSRTDLLLSQRLPIRVRALMVSRQSREPKLAADLAAFLALDADSLLMQSRYATYEGLVPVIQDKLVWQTMVSQQRYGQILAMLKGKMPQAYCSGQQIMTNWNAVLQATITKYRAELLLTADPAALTILLDQLAAAAQIILEG